MIVRYHVPVRIYYQICLFFGEEFDLKYNR